MSEPNSMLAVAALTATQPGWNRTLPLALAALLFFALGGVVWSLPPELSRSASLSQVGALAFISGQIAEAGRQLVWVDRQGNVEPLGAPRRNYVHPRLSPDGQTLTVTIGSPNDLWVYDISRDTLTRLTFGGESDQPIWTPDGRKVTFRSTRDGPTNLYWKAADGSGTAGRLTTFDEFRQNPGSWSPDGKVLAFYQRTNGPSPTDWDIWVLALEGEGKPQPFLQTRFNEAVPEFSPDGRWLAYVSDESGKNEVYVQPFPGPGAKRQISTDGGGEPVWVPSGELFYRNGDQIMAVRITTEPSFRAETPEFLFEGPFRTGTGRIPMFDATADGQRFLMIQQGGQEVQVSQMNIILNGSRNANGWFLQNDRNETKTLRALSAITKEIDGLKAISALIRFETDRGNEP